LYTTSGQETEPRSLTTPEPARGAHFRVKVTELHKSRIRHSDKELPWNTHRNELMLRYTCTHSWPPTIRKVVWQQILRGGGQF